MKFFDIVRCIATNQSEHPYLTITSTGESISYGRLSDLAGELAANLAERGVRTGSRVLLLSPNPRMFAPLLLACDMSGAALIPHDVEDRMGDLDAVLTRLAPAITISGNRRSVLANAKIIHIDDLSETSAPPVAASGHDPSAPLLLMHTAGAIKGQKLVMLGAESLLERAQALGRWFEIGHRDRFDATLPLDHMDAVMLDGLVPLVAGAHIFQSALRSTELAPLFWRRLTALDITVSHTTPWILEKVLARFPHGRPEPAPSLRFILCSGGPLPPALWQRFEDVFEVRVHHGYGLTEAGGWITATHGSGPRSSGTAGAPLPSCSLDRGRTFDTGLFAAGRDSGAVPGTDGSPPGATAPGELVVRSSGLMLGYYKNPKLTQAVLKDGSLRTGDVAVLGTDGSLTVLGRMDDIVERNGHKVWTPLIDEALKQHPAVVQCRTISIVDRAAGNRIHTACVAAPESRLTAGDVDAWLAARVPATMRPDAVTLMGRLPRSSGGAVSTHLLRQILTGELCRTIFANLNLQRFKRAQPAQPDKIQERIQEALVSGAPVRFAAYWGCGRRHHVNDSDGKALDRLARFLDGVRVAPGVRAELTLIIADMHARLNAKARERYTQYFAEIEDAARSAGMECIYLSEIWRDGGLSMDMARDRCSQPAFAQMWQELPLREALISQAEKHGEAGDPEEHARMYYIGCTLESPIIAARFPRHIWLTYSDPQLDMLIPDLPKIYLFSYRRGTSFRPWFTGNPGLGYAALRRHQRVNTDLPARYRFHSYEDFATGAVLDLSEGGVFLHTELAEQEGARIGAQVSLELTLPGTGDTFRGTGTIVRSKAGPRAGFGVAFTSLEDKYRDMLVRFVDQCNARAELMIDMSTSGIINYEALS